MLKDIKELTKKFIGPYSLGSFMALGDIKIAPYFARMCVLEYYREFYIPKSFKNWHRWKDNVLNNPAVVKTL